MKSLPAALTDIAVYRAWIVPDQAEWCCYVLTRRLGLLEFAAGVVIYALIVHKVPETAAFIIPVLMIRRRIGGWHAGTARLCQLLSLLITFVCVQVGAALTTSVPFKMLLLLTFTTASILIIASPFYPSGMNYPESAKADNIRKKNLTVILCTICEYILVKISHGLIAYCFLANTAILSGYLAGIIKERRENNEDD